MFRIVTSLFLILVSDVSFAQPRFANIFSDHMVLQRDEAINVWGWASAKEKLTVRFHNQSRSVTTDKQGKWLVSFDKESAGGPFELSVQGKKDKKSLTDILVGEVWLCSGQSNMEWPLNASLNGDEEVANSANNFIRHVKLEHEVAASPLDDIKPTSWKIANAQNSGDFTAVGYYFAKNLYKELKVPIGLINSSWGGTMVESWISKSGLQSNAEFVNVANQLPTSIEQFKMAQEDRIKNDIAKFQQVRPGEVVEHRELPDYDDTYWGTLTIPQIWESQGLPTFDGVVWYRYSFYLNDDELGGDVPLNLGTIDDNDETYVNGKLIGETKAWDKLRHYIIPKSVLKKGNNVIAVRVLDTGGGGGFYGEASGVNMQVNGKTISLAGNWKARVDVNTSVNAINPNSMPTLLYNAMINPILKFRFRGVIWYQGESNADRATQYNISFPLMINDWRTKFNQADMPFYFVQLASFNAANQNDTNGSKWAELRDAQLQTLKLPHTGMAVITDIGDSKDIHPKNKKDVGYRLAILALKNEYGKNIIASGPVYKSISIDQSRAIIQFANVGSGLLAANSKYGYLMGFMIAGSDQKFHWAKALINHSNNTVLVWSEEVATPVAVRYGWYDDNQDANLMNAEGLPASPFRTDGFPLLTKDEKYIIGH